MGNGDRLACAVKTSISAAANPMIIRPMRLSNASIGLLSIRKAGIRTIQPFRELSKRIRQSVSGE
jgi:hypothetical protein